MQMDLAFAAQPAIISWLSNSGLQLAQVTVKKVMITHVTVSHKGKVGLVEQFCFCDCGQLTVILWMRATMTSQI